MPAIAGDADLRPGMIVHDRFEIVQVIGSGAMGTVYLAEHRAVGRMVAIKVLGSLPSRRADLKRRFRAEARASAAIGHPNIVDVLDAGELPDGRPFIVMELLRGHSLLAELDRTGPMPVARACKLARDVARAIAAAHHAGIVHRDLKPENVMLVEIDGREIVKVLDFGIAAELGSSRRTAPGIVLGTPEYMAPEQATGTAPDPRIDVYALGVLVFELVTGKAPFSGAPVEILVRKAGEVAPRLEVHASTPVPKALVDLVAQCLAVDPNARPASATAVADRLDAVCAALRATAARKTAAMHASKRPRADRPHAAALSSAAALGLAAVLTLVIDQAVAQDSVALPQILTPTIPAAVDRTPPAAILDATAASTDVPASIADAPGSIDGSFDACEEIASTEPSAIAEPIAKTQGAKPRPGDPACARTRQLAAQAKRERDWPAVLRHTQSAACWQDPTDRDRMRAKALYEQARFNECTALVRERKDASLALRLWSRRCEDAARRNPR